jgi:hypothetical protein
MTEPIRPDPNTSRKGTSAMSLARVQHISISLDGFATGESPSLD